MSNHLTPAILFLDIYDHFIPHSQKKIISSTQSSNYMLVLTWGWLSAVGTIISLTEEPVNNVNMSVVFWKFLLCSLVPVFVCKENGGPPWGAKDSSIFSLSARQQSDKIKAHSLKVGKCPSRLPRFFCQLVKTIGESNFLNSHSNF